ncbi:hypothetical protein RZS08_29000, partial [Arthrospira platensis SPKY1]|nr:hypothetical protein [Arthrospira platensis SPKY1]
NAFYNTLISNDDLLKYSDYNLLPNSVSNLIIDNEPIYIPYLSSIYNFDSYNISDILKYYKSIASYIYLNT